MRPSPREPDPSAAPGPHARRSRLALAAPLLLLALAAAGAHPTPAAATTVLHLDDDALVDAAERIVHGVVTRKVVHPLPDRTAYTEYTIRVTDLLKAESGAPDGAGAPAPRDLVFREWGGRLPDGSGYWIPGTGDLAEGDEVILFLQRPDPATGVGHTTGLAQGKFRIRRDGAGKAEATRAMDDLALVDAAGRAVEVRERARDVEGLKRRIRERVAAKRGGR